VSTTTASTPSVLSPRFPTPDALGAPDAALGAPDAALGAPDAALGAPDAALGAPDSEAPRGDADGLADASGSTVDASLAAAPADADVCAVPPPPIFRPCRAPLGAYLVTSGTMHRSIRQPNPNPDPMSPDCRPLTDCSTASLAGSSSALALDPGGALTGADCGAIDSSVGITIEGAGESVVLTSSTYPARLHVTGAVSMRYTANGCSPPPTDSTEDWWFDATFVCPSSDYGGPPLATFCGGGDVMTCNAGSPVTSSVSCGRPSAAP
jgi:hypothetical protein